MSKTIPIWPWDFDDKKAYFISPDGVEWWVDEHLTSWAQRKDEVNNSSKPLKAICFIVREKGQAVERVLIDNNNDILAIDKNLEQMACKIDILRLK